MCNLKICLEIKLIQTALLYRLIIAFDLQLTPYTEWSVMVFFSSACTAFSQSFSVNSLL